MTTPEQTTPDESAPPTPRKRKRLWWILGALLLLLIVTPFGLRLYFSDNYIREQLVELMNRELEHPCDIESFGIGIWSGVVRVKGVSIQNASDVYRDKGLLRIEEVQARAPIASLAWGGFKHIEGVELVVRRPELTVERRVVDGEEVTNVDALLRKLFRKKEKKSGWPIKTGLKALAYQVELKDLAVRFCDEARGLGESRIEGFSLIAQQAALDEPAVASIAFRLVTSQTPDGGDFDGKIAIRWIDSQGQIAPTTFRDIDVAAALRDLDLPFLTQHLGLRVKVEGRPLESTLGRPLTGNLKVAGAGLEKLELKGEIQTPGLISLWERGVWRAGNLPARIGIQAVGGLKDNELDIRQVKTGVVLAGTLERTGGVEARDGMSLDLDITSDEANGLKGSLKFVTNLEELCGSDVGSVLGLKGLLGGTAAFDAKLRPDERGRWKLDGRLRTEKAYVAVRGVRQPTSMSATFDALVTPDEQGSFQKAEIRFACKTKAFEIASVEPLFLNGLNDPEALEARGRVTFKVDGKGLVAEFGPLLKAFHIHVPAEEKLAGELRLSGKPGQLDVALDNTLTRSTTPPQVLRFQAEASYMPALDDGRTAASKLRFDAKLGTDDVKQFAFRATGQASLDARSVSAELTEFAFGGSLPGLDLLARRFGLLVPSALLEADTDKARVDLKGRGQLNGTFVRAGNAGPADEYASNFELSISHPRLNGSLQLETRYDTGDDCLHLSSLEFKRAPEGRSILGGMQLAGEIARFSTLLSDGLSDPTTLSTHLDRGVRIEGLAVDTDLLFDLLRRLGVAQSFVRDVQAGVFAFGPTTLKRLQVKQGKLPGTLLATLALRTDFSMYERRIRKDRERRRVVAARGVLHVDETAPAELTLDKDGLRHAKAILNLEHLDVFAGLKKPLAFHKPAGMPGRLDGLLAVPIEGGVCLKSAVWSGGPLAFRIESLIRPPRGDDAPTLTCARASFERPIPGVASNVTLNLKKSLLSFQWSSPGVTMDQIRYFLPSDLPFQLSGSIEKTDVKYTGRPSSLAGRFVDGDKLALRSEADALVLKRELGNEKAEVTVSYGLQGDGARVAFEEMQVRLTHRKTDGKESAYAVGLSPEVRARDGGFLPQAFRADGLPIHVATPVVIKEPLEVFGLMKAIKVLQGPSIKMGPKKPPDLAMIRNMKAEISTLTVPKILVAGLIVEDLRVPGKEQVGPGILFDKLVVNVPSVAARMHGGKLLLGNCVYDLSDLPGKGLLHKQLVGIEGLDLADLMKSVGVAKKMGPYRIAGKLDAAGRLSGSGFARSQRDSWKGEVRLRLPDLVVKRTGKKKTELELAQLGIGMVGKWLGGATGRGMALLGADLGMDLESLAFQPAMARARIIKGAAVLDTGELRAKDKNEGLVLRYSGTIDLATEEFSPSLDAWLAELPPRTEALLGISKLPEAERAAVLRAFQEGKYKIVLTGPLGKPKHNLLDLAMQLERLQGRISKILKHGSSTDGTTPIPTEASTELSKEGTANPLETIIGKLAGGAAEGQKPASQPLTEAEKALGLRQALARGALSAIKQLGQKDGFFGDKALRIPVPKKLKSVDTALRFLKQDALADEFVLAMNRAAEKAVPEASGVLADAISKMKLTDIQAILTGGEDAATRHFRKTSKPELMKKLRPIVAKATGDVGVTAMYKKVVDAAGALGGFINTEDLDLETHVTRKALFGLFTRMAEEEKKIRSNPTARVTELLRRLFPGGQSSKTP